MNKAFIKKINSSRPAATATEKGGNFFTGSFILDQTGDTYIDMSKYSKGNVYINGHNLGRYWNIGPQQRLYCPASFLQKGNNSIVVFDLHQQNEETVTGFIAAE